MLPSTMAAVILTGHGGLEKLEYRTDWPVPRPASGEVLIEVLAAGINNTDINTRIGWYSKAVTSATGDGGVTGYDAFDGVRWVLVGCVIGVPAHSGRGCLRSCRGGG